jgi:hypothetical protein
MRTPVKSYSYATLGPQHFRIKSVTPNGGNGQIKWKTKRKTLHMTKTFK